MSTDEVAYVYIYFFSKLETHLNFFRNKNLSKKYYDRPSLPHCVISPLFILLPLVSLTRYSRTSDEPAIMYNNATEKRVGVATSATRVNEHNTSEEEAKIREGRVSAPEARYCEFRLFPSFCVSPDASIERREEWNIDISNTRGYTRARKPAAENTYEMHKHCARSRALSPLAARTIPIALSRSRLPVFLLARIAYIIVPLLPREPLYRPLDFASRPTIFADLE